MGAVVWFLISRMELWLVAAIAYFCGCFNGAVIISKYILRDDVRRHGSGNAGLTNFYRTFGGPLTFVVILCDVLKAVIAHMTGIVRVTGPEQIYLLPVILRPGILTADEAGKGLARRFSPEIAADDLRRVALLARRGESALAGGTACHLMQHVLHVDLHARGEAVQRHAHGRAVGLSEQGQAKVISEAAAHAI